MQNLLYAFLFFVMGYTLNMFYITVLYHRGLTHRSLTLSPWMLKWLGQTGVWVTGLEPKAWAAMHRLHHEHSDTEADPHSPKHMGLLGVWKGQYVGYTTLVKKLSSHSDEKVNSLVTDIPFEISFINKRNLSWLPYIVHGAMAIGLSLYAESLLIGLGYFLGLMSHPVQGWMVNALAHRFGNKNFPEPDNSRNNLLVAWLVFGEGLQNNHHARPFKANFSVRKRELDLGYWMCVMAEKLQLLKINQ